MPELKVLEATPANIRAYLPPATMRKIGEAFDRYFEANPHYGCEELREIDQTSARVKVVETYCKSCGATHRPQNSVTVVDTLQACRWTHITDRRTGEKCGGEIAFVVEPV